MVLRSLLFISITLCLFSIFSKAAQQSIRLRYFQLQMFDEQQTILFSYTDSSNDAMKKDRSFPNATVFNQHIFITATDISESLYLILGEVELYASCIYGTYEPNCKHNCSGGCNNPPCVIESGYCRGGCIDGFKGDKCRQEQVEYSNQSRSDIEIVELWLGIGAAAMTLSVVVLCVIFYIRRRRLTAYGERENKEQHVYNKPTQSADESNLYVHFNSSVQLNETRNVTEQDNTNEDQDNVYNVIA